MSEESKGKTVVFPLNKNPEKTGVRFVPLGVGLEEEVLKRLRRLKKKKRRDLK